MKEKNKSKLNQTFSGLSRNELEISNKHVFSDSLEN